MRGVQKQGSAAFINVLNKVPGPCTIPLTVTIMYAVLNKVPGPYTT